ncbi:hypothetical protein C8R43DRAFT_889617 [Mycena crocata]|nr:hypothetical protein C8R43DRAFT_889617 [Mycena crocata]
MPFTGYTLITFAVILVAVLYAKRTPSKFNLPPGPRKLTLVGNLFDIPSAFEWETYHEWSKQYRSDILHINVFGASIIILSSL